MSAEPMHAPSWTLAALLAPWSRGVTPLMDRALNGLTLDSRQVRPGDLFLACAGRSGHGLNHAPDAAAHGARAVAFDPAGWAESLPKLAIPMVAVSDLGAHASALAGRFFGEPAADLRVIGITGTNGKTSCAHLLAQTLGHPPGVAALLGTLGNGYPDALVPSTHTTLNAVAVQAWLARLRDEGARAVAMEVSSHALDQARVAAVHFDTAIFTNLTRDHLDYHGSEAAYAAAKRRLFEQAALRLAVLWSEDPASAAMRAALSARCEVVWAGFSPYQGRLGSGASRLWVRAMTPTAKGLDLVLTGDWGTGALHLPLLGRFNVANALLVLSALLGGGIPWDEALRRLSVVRPVPGRMQRLGGGTRPQAVVDYAHTPDALAQALAACREHGARRVVCVFGCGGDRDRGKRSLMGAVAGRLADAVVLTDDNPRNEDPDTIIAAIRTAIPAGTPVRVERDRRAAIVGALEAAAPGDWVLVAGKGHETGQIFADRQEPFSDEAVVAEWLGETP